MTGTPEKYFGLGPKTQDITNKLRSLDKNSKAVLLLQ